MAVIDTSFFVTGGETNRPPSKDVNPTKRYINIHAPFSVPSADGWSGEKVWLLIPGFTAPCTDYI